MGRAGWPVGDIPSRRTDSLRCLALGPVSPLRSQALYHGLAEAMREGTPDTLILCWPDAPHFCVGYHQSADRVLDVAGCRRAGWPVLRRRIGGGAVYLDDDQLFYQVVVHRSRAPFAVADIYAKYLAAPVRALERLGLRAGLSGVNEVEVGGRRIGGTGGGQLGEAVVVVGNILFDFRRARMARAWRVPSHPFRQLADGGLRRYLTTLRVELRPTPPMDAVARLLTDCYAETLGRPVVPGTLARDEERAVVRAEAELAGEAVELDRTARPERGLKIARGVFVRETWLPGGAGPRRLTVRIRDGTLDAVVLTPRLDAPWVRALAGASLERAALGARLGDVPERSLVIDTLLALAHGGAETG